MDEQLLNILLKEGAFAALFVWMLYSTMKNNVLRESEYQKVIAENQTVIKEQAKAFSLLAIDVNEIKQIIVMSKQREVDK